jgi:hypothetical protein
MTLAIWPPTHTADCSPRPIRTVTRGRAAIARMYAARFPHLRAIIDIEEALAILPSEPWMH